MADKIQIVPGMEMTLGTENYKMTFDAEKSNWVEMNDLDDHSYFKTKRVVPEMYSGDHQAYHQLGIRSKIMRDPGNTGGSECICQVSENDVMFSGKIDWYAEDESLGRVAGNRVGVMVKFPEDITDEQLAKLRINIGGKVYSQNALDEYEGKKVLWYYPLVKGDFQSFQIKLIWDPETEIEIFNIAISGTTVLKSEADMKKSAATE